MNPILVQLAKSWVDGAADIGLPKKGKRRDEHALAYMQGAVNALMMTGTISEQNASGLRFVLSVRGSSEVERWAGL